MMPPLVRLYVRETLLGLALGILFSMALVVLNIGNLRHLIDTVEGGWLAFLLLSFFNGIVFAGVQFGVRVMLMADPED
ncbi:hypothetical protein EF888_05170 [Silicimonas algicola]|uniref:ABC transporter permease n=2 Tax=Silicimonas algicola TaxID=1826607 RepID=A0A316GG48_9RHOB|nr:hypothetical protein [Silicimonas algicola]AZQ66583.1 hypothetical protein EF888_05170 [Silicimonas algicola]PWK58926.1 hypothetical protein C8D95_101746 [Silicimonas algicola]